MGERERFEAWAKARHNEMQIIKGEYTCPFTRDLWQAWQAACPEGWQCVPKKQTRHMAYAAEETELSEFCTSSRQSVYHDLGRQIYEANLAAAPKPWEEN